jgi:DNA gyrase inhibitor GyrI
MRRRIEEALVFEKNKVMATIDVRIKELIPMRVASVRVTSTTPEIDAWTRLKTWAVSKNLPRDGDRHPVFGYTCQPPKEGEKEYAYEFWMGIGTEMDVRGEVGEQWFTGGWYAVTTHHGPPAPEVWKQLWEWIQASPYRWRKIHELEQPRNPWAPESEWVFDLYLPIETVHP